MLTLVWISVLIPILNEIVRFKFVTKEALLCAVPKTPSNCLLTLILLLTSSILRTKNLSVLIPRTSFAATESGDKSPDTDILVIIPVAPVVPIPMPSFKNEVLNPIWCLPSSVLRVSVERPETVTSSPITKSWGWDDNPVTSPLDLSYVNTTFSILTTVDAIDIISFPSTVDISPENPFPFPILMTRRSSLTW